MARVPYIDVADMPAPLDRMLAGEPPLNLYKAVAHAGDVTAGFLLFGGALLRQGRLDPRLRELVILRVGFLSGAEYEVHQHRQVASLVGVPEAQVEALAGDLDGGPFDAAELDVLRLTDALVAGVRAPEELIAPVAQRLSDSELVELLMLVGNYMLVCRLLENLGVEIEDADLVDRQALG
jgi:alkylhydroperoxidase family enzyme